MTSEVTLKAKVVQVLDWYELPELLLLETPSLEYILAVRSADLEATPNTYVGGSMTARRLRDYANGKCDLRFAIAHANLRRFWKFSYPVGEPTVELQRIKRSDAELAKSLPIAGLFASDHEDIDLVKTYVPNTTERFNIDGSWDLGEFSQFYSQVEDVYYISSDIEKFDDPSITTDEKKTISGAFDRSWDGGGSYVAFYKRVANDNDYHAPLRVSGIQYNSPGHVKIHAKSEYFDTLMKMLQYYADNQVAAKKAFYALGAFMSAAKMKQKGYRNSHMTDAQREGLEKRASELAAQMPGVSFDTLKEMTNGNSLVAAKVLESVFRRLKKLYRFFEEGRVAHEQLAVK